MQISKLYEHAITGIKIGRISTVYSNSYTNFKLKKKLSILRLMSSFVKMFHAKGCKCIIKPYSKICFYRNINYSSLNVNQLKKSLKCTVFNIGDLLRNVGPLASLHKVKNTYEEVLISLKLQTVSLEIC